MKIVIAEDHKLIAEGLRHFLNDTEYDLLHAATKEEVFELLATHSPDILVQDIRMGKDDARTFLPELRVLYPRLPILALTSLDDLGSIQSVLALGVKGYVLKSEDLVHVSLAIKALIKGESYISPLASEIIHENTVTDTPIVLSEREKEVLKGILEEKSTRQIAEAIFVSDKTVEHYRASLFVKFDVKNVSGLVKRAILLGFYQ